MVADLEVISSGCFSWHSSLENYVQRLSMIFPAKEGKARVAGAFGRLAIAFLLL